ncbi:MAG: hypothetical protein R6V12_07285 [Candidatus Hydrogenedentota bacterium]
MGSKSWLQVAIVAAILALHTLAGYWFAVSRNHAIHTVVSLREGMKQEQVFDQLSDAGAYQSRLSRGEATWRFTFPNRGLWVQTRLSNDTVTSLTVYTRDGVLSPPLTQHRLSYSRMFLLSLLLSIPFALAVHALFRSASKENASNQGLWFFGLIVGLLGGLLDWLTAVFLGIL